MATNELIGKWVKREGARDLTKVEDGPEWHLVETVINGNVITRCGRSMVDEVYGAGLEVSDVEPLTRMIGQPQLCNAGCQR